MLTALLAFIAHPWPRSHNHRMVFVVAGLLGIGLLVFCPVLEELLANLLE